MDVLRAYCIYRENILFANKGIFYLKRTHSIRNKQPTHLTLDFTTAVCRERERERESERDRERERMCVCVCVRERERECVCV